ncbi:MAG: hypothetical protein IPI49_22170 [Myxococcales bacterium]|nr:hypothetical protein [Myxococcales bacterium]
MKLRVFVSHSFHAEHHLHGKLDGFRNSVDAARVEVLSHAKLGLRDVSIDLHFEDTAIGQLLPARTRIDIECADIFIIDISARTANTFFELGYARALGVETIVIQQRSIQESIPANVADLLVGFYGTTDELRQIVARRLSEILGDVASLGASRPRDRCFWFEPDVREVHIVCGSEPEATRFANRDSDDYLLIDNFDDRDALFALSTLLSRAYPNANLVRHTSANLPPDIYHSNLVLVGGPLTNRVAAEMMAELNVKVRYLDGDDGIEFQGPRGLEIVRSQRDASGVIVADAGYFGRFRNPFARRNRIIMCQGCHTFGTLAASAILADDNQAQDNARYLEKLSGVDARAIARIECVFSVRVLTNRRVLPAAVTEPLTFVHVS